MATKLGFVGGWVLLVAISLVSAGPAAGQPTSRPEPVGLFPVYSLDYSQYGYIDSAGKLAIPMRFKMAGPFSEGLAAAKVGKQFGYVDAKGEFVIEARFDDAKPFSEGLAVVMIYNNRPIPGGKTNGFGVIDRTGKYVVEPTLDTIDSFSDGLAYVTNAGYLDKTGKIAILQEKTWQDCGPFSDGLAPVKMENKWGFIDKAGALAVKPEFGRVGRFCDGLAPARLAGDDGKFGFVDKAGKVVIEAKSIEAAPFSEGLAAVQVAEDKWGFIDKAGKLVIAQLPGPAGSRPDSFSEGLAAVGRQDDACFIDKAGKVAFKIPFYQSEPFQGGVAKIGWNKVDMYINAKGQIIWNPLKNANP